MAVVMMGGDDKDPTFHDFLGMSSSSNNGDADNGNGSSSPPPNPNTSNREMVDAEASVGFSSGAHRVVSGTSDLGSERQGQNNSEIFHFHGRKDTVVDRETSNTLSGRKRNSSSSYMSLIRDRMLSLGSNSIEGSQPIKAFGRSHDDAVPYSVQPPPRPTSSLLLQTAVNVRPDLLFSKWEQSLPMNAGSVGPYSSHFGQSGTQMEMLTSYTHKDANISATVITSSAADEGSRTGMKGSGILKMISPSSSKAGEKYSTGRMLYSNNPKAPEVVEPESSNLRSRCNLTPSTRQMTIFYAGQAHVFDDVHPNKADIIMALAGSNGGSWSTNYFPKSGTGPPASETKASIRESIDVGTNNLPVSIPGIPFPNDLQNPTPGGHQGGRVVGDPTLITPAVGLNSSSQRDV